MHLTCRKDRIHNRLQAKKNEELVPSEDILKNKYSDIIDAESSNYEEVTKKTNSRIMMSRMQY